MTEATAPVTYATQELLSKFRELRLDDWRKRCIAEVLGGWAVRQIADLPQFAAQHLYEHLTRPEKGLEVSVVPSDADYDRMTERNKRRFAKKHLRVIGIENMMLDDFEKMAQTDQFLFLKARLPDKTMPITIQRWFK